VLPIGIGHNLSVYSLVSSNTFKENMTNATINNQLAINSWKELMVNNSVTEVSFDKISDEHFYKELTSIEDGKDAYFAKRLFQEFFNGE